jgi:hypothetical protein
MKELLEDAARRAISYLDSLNARRVYPTPEAIANLEKLDEPLPDEPTEPEAVMRLLDEICTPATMAMAGPRFFGFVIGGSLPVTLAANWLVGSKQRALRGHTGDCPAGAGRPALADRPL